MDWLRPSPADGQQLYVLAVSSMPEVYSRDVMLQSGADDYLAKPINGDDVLRAPFDGNIVEVAKRSVEL